MITAYDYFKAYWRYIQQNWRSSKNFVHLKNRVTTENKSLYSDKLEKLREMQGENQTITSKQGHYKKNIMKKIRSGQKQEFTQNFREEFKNNERNQFIVENFKRVGVEHALMGLPNRAF